MCNLGSCARSPTVVRLLSANLSHELVSSCWTEQRFTQHLHCARAPTTRAPSALWRARHIAEQNATELPYSLLWSVIMDFPISKRVPLYCFLCSVSPERFSGSWSLHPRYSRNNITLAPFFSGRFQKRQKTSFAHEFLNESPGSPLSRFFFRCSVSLVSRGSRLPNMTGNHKKEVAPRGVDGTRTLTASVFVSRNLYESSSPVS